MTPRFYITTPIYYVNDVPHIGHAYTTIAADVMARYRRLGGYEVFFLTGTDEHGQKVKEAAARRGIDPQQHVDELHVRFKELWRRFQISNTDFIRTTEERHKRVVRDILQDLYDRKEIYLDTYEGWYCTPCERFFTEKDLKDRNCPECGRAVDKIQESNYFFRMGRYQDWLVDTIANRPGFIRPEARKNEILGFLKKPLGDLCISRPRERLPWGIPLPFDDRYVTYVWFDALINYISVHGTVPEIKTSGFWPADHHLIGKDILTTHSVYWSTMLRAIGLELPKNIFAHGWWTVNGQKMSKSLFNVVEPNKLIDQFGVDVIRYFLMREVPFGQDGDFSHKALIGRVNSDLANNLGNLLNRTLNMVNKYCEGRIPAPATEGPEDAPLLGKARAVIAEVDRLFDELAFNKILIEIWEFLDAANLYVNDTAPWNLAKSEETRGRLATVLYNACEALRVAAVLLHPFMPQSAETLCRQLGLADSPEAQGLDSIRQWGGLKPGGLTAPGPQLFPRIEEKQAQEILKTATAAPEDEPAPAADPLEPPIGIEDFMKVDLRTGVVLEAEKIPKSKKLLKLKVDIGLEQRQVVAGIAQSYAPEQLVGRTVILVANLKPAKLMGVESQGMILAGSDPAKIVVAGFDDALPPGTRVR